MVIFVTTFNGNVTLAIGNNPTTTGTLSGTLTVAAVNGVASFSGISVNTMGTGYSLTASSAGLSGPSVILSTSLWAPRANSRLRCSRPTRSARSRSLRLSRSRPKTQAETS